MPQNYTPTATWNAYPVSIFSNGDFAEENYFNDRWKDVYNREEYLKTNLDLTTGRFDAALTKLGITVTGPTDNIPPTYTSGFVLSTSRTHHSALEVLDLQLKSHNTNISNINNNCGGNVINGVPPQYASTFFIANDDPHHTAIEKLDTAANDINISTATNAANIATQTTRIDNVVAKIGASADAVPGFVYTTHNFISDGDLIKAIIEKYDKVLLGGRRTNEYNFSQWVLNWARIEGTDVKYQGYESFYDLTKRNVTYTTCTIDMDQQRAYGNGTLYYTIPLTATATVSQLSARWNSTGTVTVKFNLIGSYNDANMTTITTQDTWTAGLSAGTSVVVKVEFTGTAELYGIGIIAKV